jgi:exosortase C (VPDSG-CTERM-specific)
LVSIVLASFIYFIVPVILLVIAGGFLFLGVRWMKRMIFPAAFLFFAVPMPDRMADHLENWSKLGSAETASWFFTLSGVPVLRDGVFFQLPGITLEVAQECSGIRSSWVLLITSVLAAYLFLRTPWRRALLVLLVLPLGLLRNGFRILVIGLLCVYVSPDMINSVIHHRGGPIFFVISLVPLFILLRWFRKQERAGS